MDCKPTDTSSEVSLQDQPNWQQQLDQMRAENFKLQQKLDDVSAIATANETIWRHFLEIERVLFCTRRFDLLVEELLGEIKQRFQIDWVLLFLTHPNVLERFFPDLPENGRLFDEGSHCIWIIHYQYE